MNDLSLVLSANGSLTLSAENGDQLTIAADASTLPQLLTPGGALFGTFTNAGGTYSYTTQAAVDPGGLYQGEQHLTDGTGMEGGTVVLNDGESRGSATVSLRGVTPVNVGFAGIGQSGGTPRITQNPYVTGSQFMPFTTTLIGQPHGTGVVVLPITVSQFTAPLPFRRQTATTLGFFRVTRLLNGTGRQITFTILETGFATQLLRLNSGELITLVIQNTGQTFHNWHLLHARGDDGTPLASSMLAAGQSDTMTFWIDQPGEYMFVDDMNPTVIFGRLVVS